MAESMKTEEQIFTIGYEKSSIGDFVSRLADAEIEMLVDVRELPLSRKKGFSKKGLNAAVTEAGIDYLHVKALGDPKPGRDAARAGNHDLFVSIFTRHMESDIAQSALSELADIVRGKRVCLTCFERHHEGCHRKIVAERLSALLGTPVEHIAVN
ncbi:DUF488 family protein [Roseicyclus mahoneyensis]|jgi:uncharacterized protein (DUF488 family)|uniref:Uncharacterized protein DUF488 n=1 Tax=Roseicyclus mahoneyensis TaxID=164332 RepID=A0A316GX17_9RHOB|nr:DUF488 domain-containing protein [Roseicyclus mahoneyensis]PWK59619.1 uncharacterized protein DUF488 [Roseicyclus mahoneyensis]